MTEQQKEDIVNAQYIATNILPGEDAAVLLRILDDWERTAEKLECVRTVVLDSLPKLDEAYRRYGCKEGKCEKLKCGRSWPCQANGIRVVANDLRDCLGIEK